jgi:replicative DNA helicase
MTYPSLPPPYNELAERICLGTVMLLGHKPFDFLRNEKRFTKDFFYLPAHLLVFEAMDALFTSGLPCDFHAVEVKLTRDGTLDRVGGALFLDGIQEAGRIDGLIELYAEQVKQDHDRRLIIACARKMEAEAFNPENEDARSVAATGIEELCRIAEARQTKKTVAQLADESIARWDELAALKRENKPVPLKGYSTGHERLDRLLGGLQVGLTVIGAQESTGKTSIEGQMLMYAMKNSGVTTLRFTRDSQDSDLVARDIVRESFAPMHYLNAGYMNAVQRERLVTARDSIVKANVRIIDDVFKLPDILAVIRADVARRGTRIVSLDYLQLLRCGDKLIDRSPNQRTEELVTALKGIAGELKIAVVVLSQFSREQAEGFHGGPRPINWLDSRPKLARLRDSGSIEQQADVAILMSKVCDLDDGEGRMTGEATLIGVEVAKNRNGAKGVIMMRFDGPCFKFEEIPDLQQRAIAKCLKDERELAMKHVKLDNIEQPYFCTIQDALMRYHMMEPHANEKH